MRMKIDYFDNLIEFDYEYINVIEIENKNYFYRFVQDVNLLLNNLCDEIHFFENINELNMSDKISVYVDYFNFNFDNKKNLISKYIVDNISDLEKSNLLKYYNKFYNYYLKVLNNIEIPLNIDEDINIDNIIKNMKSTIKTKQTLFDNLLLLIDVEKILKNNKIIFFINLKQYLSNNELIELYKYSIYNQIHICLIDSQSYKRKLKYEKKLDIDEDLEEFVI